MITVLAALSRCTGACLVCVPAPPGVFLPVRVLWDLSWSVAPRGGHACRGPRVVLRGLVVLHQESRPMKLGLADVPDADLKDKRVFIRVDVRIAVAAR
jgi:hypothetical protein